MENKYIDDLLVEAIGRYSLFGNDKSTKYVFKKLPTMGYTHSMPFDCDNGFAICISVLDSYGEILDINVENQAILGMVGSGCANMNPAIIVIQIENKMMYIASAAKEGLIKQKTAEKAVKKFIATLNGI